jgi:hypothetical protein
MVGSAGKENLNDVGRGLKQATEAGKDECATVCRSLLVELSCIDSPSTLKMRDPNRLRQGGKEASRIGTYLDRLKGLTRLCIPIWDTTSHSLNLVLVGAVNLTFLRPRG